MTILSTNEIPWQDWIWFAFTALAYYGMLRDAARVWKYKRKVNCSPRQIEKLVEARKAFRNWWKVAFVLTFMSAAILYKFYKG